MPSPALRRAWNSLTLLGCAVSAFAPAVALTRPWSMMFWPAGAFPALVAALVAALALGLSCTRVRTIAPATRSGGLRFAVCMLVLLAIPWFVFIQPFKALWLLMYVGVACGAVAALRLALPRLRPALPPRVARGAEITLFNLCALLLGAELVLRVIAAAHPSPLFEVGATTNAIFARYRMAPGAVHLGFPCDRRGFNDTLVRAPDSTLVACIGDSFSFGLVPHALHYTTVAEHDLKGVEIYNAGVIAAGPAEYLRILQDDILPLRPDAIVLALFVGNDIEESSRFGAHWPLLEYVFDRSHLMLAEIPSRLLTMLRERSASGGRAVGTIQGEDDPHVDVTEDLNTLRARMPWLDDPSREQPTMTEATFLEVERRRAELVCSPGSDHAYAHCYAALDAILAAAGPTPLAVVLIPDEFQVEDSLWIRVAAPKRIRERAQMLLRTWLAARDVPVLDLLPAMLASKPLQDGERHLYHRHDTHWNRRGNEVAGHALAGLLRTWLRR